MAVLWSERLLEGKLKAVMMEFGHKSDKARVVCKCESMQDANKKAERFGLGSKWFKPECCEEARSEDEVDLLNVLKDSDMAICMDGNNFLSIDSEIRDKLLR